jgi:hypothetical protein
MGKTKEGLGAFQSVIVVVLMAGGAGAALTWNFGQQEEFRPFKSYDDAGVQDLVDVYGVKLEEVDARYENIAGKRPDVEKKALLGESVGEFERVQNISQRTRRAGHEVSYAMADQKNLERELWIRAHPIEHFWNTATRF